MINYLLDDNDETIETYIKINDETYLLCAETENQRIYRNNKGEIYFKEKETKHEEQKNKR